MTESAVSGVSQDIAGLRLAGVDKFDPVRFHYVEVLARRASAHQGQLKEFLERKVAQAVLVLRQDFDQAQTEARRALDELALDDAHGAASLPAWHQAGDLAALRQGRSSLKTGVPGASLGDLAQQLLQGRSADPGARVRGRAAVAGAPDSTQYFRNAWSRLSVDKRVSQALEQAPKNAGPMNSHRLVLRSLALMREISPDYLTRFTAYVDTLLCLDQNEKPAKTKKASEPEAGKKPGSRSGRSQPREKPKSV